ncbi:MAG: hypothetical protein JXA01_08540 [Dehalococcoidia bacterium]|nr:hypothetical protein [Dehalococcoidia bacterium]
MGRFYILIAMIICIFPACIVVADGPSHININSLQVIPSMIEAGQPAVLSWNVTGAVSVTINNGLGERPASGSIEVNPQQTTTYILTAKNGGTPVESSVILTVTERVSPPAAEQIPTLSALDTQGLLKHQGEQVLVEGDVTYISSWLPTRLRGLGTGRPWTFMFFMEDIMEGAADNAGVGEYCPECWRDYTSHFRVIITPERLPLLLPALNSYFGGGLIVEEQWLIVGATDEGRLVYVPSQLWNFGFVAQSPVHIGIKGKIDNYLTAPAIYLTDAGQISAD